MPKVGSTTHPLIINIRGTSGSGKTTVMREVVGALTAQDWEAVRVDEWQGKKRKQPLYYRNKSTGLITLGHYESTCGGCDNVGSARQVYELIQLVRSKYPKDTILCEGLLLSEDTKWCSQLPNLKVLYLETDVEECLKRVRARRLEAGNDKPLKEDNTRNRVAVIERSRIKLESIGVYCRSASSSVASQIILEWIR